MTRRRLRLPPRLDFAARRGIVRCGGGRRRFYVDVVDRCVVACVWEVVTVGVLCVDFGGDAELCAHNATFFAGGGGCGVDVFYYSVYYYYSGYYCKWPPTQNICPRSVVLFR